LHQGEDVARVVARRSSTGWKTYDLGTGQPTVNRIPALAVTPTGEALVAWPTPAQGGGFRVVVRRYNRSQDVWSPAEDLDLGNVGAIDTVSAVASGPSTFVVVALRLERYGNAPGPYYHARAYELDVATGVVSPAIRLDVANRSVMQFSIASTADHSLRAVWLQAEDAPDGGVLSIPMRTAHRPAGGQWLSPTTDIAFRAQVPALPRSVGSPDSVAVLWLVLEGTESTLWVATAD
jgi:hypothetical protein